MTYLNLNPYPVQVRVRKAFRLDGEDHRPGEETEIPWLHYKFLVRDETVERIYSMKMNSDPIRDVMVFCPVYRLEPETVRAIMQLEWDGPLTVVLQKDNPEDGSTRPAGIRNHLHQYRRGRELFLQGSYDAMLVVESDIVPPADTIRRLRDLQADVAYGVYRFRASDVINIAERYPPPAANPGESLSVKPWLLQEALKKGKTPCSGAGLGCTLIRRVVLEQIDFRTVPGGGHCDTPFNMDVYQAGFSQMADMLVVCGHKEDGGEVLWPSDVKRNEPQMNADKRG